MADARLEAFVSGEVQMVGFRMFVQRHARQLGLRGFVRNLPDGRVEVGAEGDRAALERLLDLLHRGPPAAVVQRVECQWAEPRGEVGFRAY
jgi:acylphosphatase